MGARAANPDIDELDVSNKWQNMNEAALVSVVMSVYNCETYIRTAIESILNQTYPYLEFIIIDDGSTDKTRTIIEAATATDPRVRLISRENRGVTQSLNEGISLSAGKLIARMDGDDISELDRLEKQVAFLDANPEVVLVGGQAHLIDSDGRSVISFTEPVNHDEIDQRNLRAKTLPIHPTVMFRKSAWSTVGGYHMEFDKAEDIDLFLRLAKIGRLASLSDVVLKMRLHLGSVSNITEENRRQQTMSARAAAQAAASRRGLPPQQFSDQIMVENPADTMTRWAWWALKHSATLCVPRPLRPTLLSQELDTHSLCIAGILKSQDE